MLPKNLPIKYTDRMSKKLAIFDIDGTLFRWQLYHELIYRLKDQGYFPPAVSTKLDEAFLGWTSRHRSFRDYETEMIELSSAHLPSIPVDAFEQAARDVVASSGHKVYRYTRDLLARLKSEGYYCLALSGSQQEVVEQFAPHYGFDDWIGTIFERDGNAFTGQITRFVPYSKGRIITGYAKEHGFDLADAIAIGDSGGDTAILEVVGHPIAVNPNEELLAIATANRWPVVIERKNISYELETREDGEIVVKNTTIY